MLPTSFTGLECFAVATANRTISVVTLIVTIYQAHSLSLEDLQSKVTALIDEALTKSGFDAILSVDTMLNTATSSVHIYVNKKYATSIGTGEVLHEEAFSEMFRATIITPLYRALDQNNRNKVLNQRDENERQTRRGSTIAALQKAMIPAGAILVSDDEEIIVFNGSGFRSFPRFAIKNAINREERYRS